MQLTQSHIVVHSQHSVQEALKKVDKIGPHGSAAFYYFSPNHTEVNIKRHFCGGTEANRCSSAKLTYHPLADQIISGRTEPHNRAPRLGALLPLLAHPQ